MIGCLLRFSFYGSTRASPKPECGFRIRKKKRCRSRLKSCRKEVTH